MAVNRSQMETSIGPHIDMATNVDNDEGSLSQSPDDTPAQDMSIQGHSKIEEDGNGGTGQKKLDPKDPSRPRRKKARRACFACQRAHLTCGMFGHLFRYWLITETRRRAAMSKVYQTWTSRCLPRWRA